MAVLSDVQRDLLRRAVERGRVVAEAAGQAALVRLGVAEARPGGHLLDEERALRRALQARARQLGDPLDRAGASEDPHRLLTGEVAYEQWHRLLFARFLEVNGLLRHPEFGVPVSLAECEELADDLGESDGWSVAAGFAAEILPGIFKPSDPCVRVRLAREDLLALERVVVDLPAEVFAAEDALGWVYQFWQSQAKAEVNASGRKIGGADISPVTQLFTEHYMVRFLLENSLGAWWASRHPDSPLLAGFDYLRRDADGAPAAGTFEGWPQRVAEVTVMDPCCGSGHFLVAAFGMLWRMRAEEERLEPAAAQDAVLRENLFGLELDPRCTQIAMFAVALEAWKQGGYRTLPVPNVACSGIPAKAPLAEWTKLADGDERLEAALGRLHALFRDADTLGSLIDPVRATQQGYLDDVDWREIAPLLDKALHAEAAISGDPAAEVFGDAAAGIARAADLLSRHYNLVATNPPFLSRTGQSDVLRNYGETVKPEGKYDLATMFLLRLLDFVPKGTLDIVAPSHWTQLSRYVNLRRKILDGTQLQFLAFLGSGAFGSISGEVVNVLLLISTPNGLAHGGYTRGLEAQKGSPRDKARALRDSEPVAVLQSSMRMNPDSRLLLTGSASRPLLGTIADSRYGLRTGDASRLIRKFWEVNSGDRWVPHQSTPAFTLSYGGREHVLRWDEGRGPLSELASLGIASIQGGDAWGRLGVAVSLMGDLPTTLYAGDKFDNNCAVVWPKSIKDLPVLWAYLSSREFSREVRRLDGSIKVTNATLVKVPFDLDNWQRVAAEAGPLAEPHSDDPTQWLFKGVPAGSTAPLQVAVARLLGFRWPDQEPDAVDDLVDSDGIVCLPAVAGERPAADRVREVLVRSFGEAWSGSVLDELLAAAGGKPGDFAGWLRDGFFKDHCRVFGNRPFIWHVWDGRRDGFSALVNYHCLDRATLERLTYTTLGWWIDRQRADADARVTGAETRLAAAEELQRKLALILEGEPPFDIFVRWKSLAEQSLGWDPDLDDGVRLNIRPFVEAGVLRAKLTIHWKKDRGTNPDGSERHNDLHYTLAQKRTARGDRNVAK